MGRNDDGLYRQQLITALLKYGIVTPGNIFYLDPTNGDDANDGLSVDQAKATLPEAYDLLTAGQHDVLFYIAGSSSISLAVSFTWAKDYTHFIGVCAPTYRSQRARIFHSANFTPMITFSADGCIWKDLYMSYGRGAGANLIQMAMTGDRNYFENVHFACMNNSTEAATAASRGLVLTGAGENTFRRCTLGNNSIARGAAVATLELASACEENLFDDCLFTAHGNASGAGSRHIFVNALGILRCLWLKNCRFVNYGTAQTQAIDNNETAGDRLIIMEGEPFFVGSTDVADATGDQNIFCPPQSQTANTVGLAISPAAS